MRYLLIITTLAITIFMFITFYPTSYQEEDNIYIKGNTFSKIMEDTSLNVTNSILVQSDGSNVVVKDTSTPSSGHLADYIWMVPDMPFHTDDTFASSGRPGHGALDIGGQGSSHDIVAAYDGTVVRSGWLAGGSGYGNSVVLQHIIDGVTVCTKYNHLASCSANVGETVKAGQKIGVMGGTANTPGVQSFAIHLDFQMYIGEYSGNPNANLVDPSSVMCKLIDNPNDLTTFTRHGNSTPHTVIRQGKDIKYAGKNVPGGVFSSLEALKAAYYKE